MCKPIIRNFKKRTVCYGFKNNIWDVDLAVMQSLGKYNKGIKHLLCAVDLFSKYAWVISMKDKKGVSIVDAFQKRLEKSNRKPSEISVWQREQFYNNSFKK